MAGGDVAAIIVAILGTGGIGAIMLAWKKIRDNQTATQARHLRVMLDFAHAHYQRVITEIEGRCTQEIGRLLERIERLEKEVDRLRLVVEPTDQGDQQNGDGQ
jgi:site-specific recombinase